jgi:hypothetical protein
MTKATKSRSERSRKNYKPATAAKQAIAADMEKMVAKAFSTVPTTNNAAFDVMVSEISLGIEVKTMVDQKADKITMRSECLRRKLATARTLRLKAVYTVVVDARGPEPVVYYRKGLGSFRLGSLLRAAGFQALPGVCRGGKK